MEKMICSCCGAAIVPSVAQAFLTCEYCDTSVANPYYDEAAAAEAAKPSLQETCLKALIEMGEAEKLAKLDPDCFGDPIHGLDSARVAMGIPDAEQVYFLYAHTVLLIGFSDGIALTDSGLYYKLDGESGSRSWEAFITGAISCVDRVGKQDGTLTIGSSLSINVGSDKDSRLARFLVDFHNHVYRLHTGETAPAAWAVTEGTAAAEEDNPSLLGTLIPAVGALLGGAALRKTTIAKRPPAMHPTSRPTVRQDRRDHIEPPRPLHSQPHQRPAARSRAIGGMARPGMGSQRHPGGMGNPGQRGPGLNAPGGQRRPGGMGNSGRSGKGRR